MKKEDLSIKLSIITPYYNALPYIKKLGNILIPQLNDNIEWIVIDDGTGDDLSFLCSPYVKVLYLPINSGGASVPRNVGLDNARGEYVAFIDSDDLVSADYIYHITNKINNETFDYCYLSWYSDAFKVIIEDNPPDWNLCVWNCVYKRDLIGNERFKPELIIAEDYDFNVRVRKGKHTSITDIIYYYNNTPNSLMKRGKNNE